MGEVRVRVKSKIFIICPFTLILSHSGERRLDF
jgi:hypothetical protein